LYPDKAFKIFVSNLLKPFGSYNYKSFIILSRRRTGSSLIHSYLNASPHILARGEIFQTLKGRSYQDILAWVFSKHPSFIKAVGFKIHYDHPADDHHCGIWDDLKDMKNLHVIHLTRKNILRSFLSEKIARQSGVWTTKDKAGVTDHRTAEKPVLDLSVAELKEAFEKTRALEKSAGRMFADHPVLDIHYETLAQNPDMAINRIAEFLCIPHFYPKTRLKKQNPYQLSEIINRYDDLKAAFADTPWHEFFEE